MTSIARHRVAASRAGGLLVIVLTAWLLASCSRQPGELTITMLDVGQGDPLLLHQPGGCTALIDAGGLLHGHRVTESILGLDVDHLDLVVVSHPHLDHFGGLFDIVPRIGIARAFDNGGSNPAHEYFDDYLALRRNLPITALQRGDRLFCGDLEISVLHPQTPPTPQDDINGSSLALLIRFHDFRLLHLGDIGGPWEKALLSRPDDLRADLLKVAHHGAGDATSPPLLERVSPTYALIGCAADNRIAAPHPVVLERLEAAGVQVLRTDRDGTITFTVAPDRSLTVATENHRRH